MSWVHIRYGLYGLLFGFVLSRMGFADVQEVHRMFVFADLRLLFSFGGGIALSMVGFLFVLRHHNPPRRPIHPGSLWGGLLFGAGWAITGACPSIVCVQLGDGQAPALATLVGVLVGVILYKYVHRRFFRWEVGRCSA